MTPRSYPCITNIIRDLVNSIEDHSGIDLPSAGFNPAEKFAIESFLIGVLDRYGKVKCNSGTSDQSNSNGSDLPSPNTPPSTPVSTPKESQSATIDLDTTQTSPASDANSTSTVSRGSCAESKHARTKASKSSSPAKAIGYRDAAAYYDPDLKTGGDTENNDPSQGRDESDSDASEQSQLYVPASSPPNEKKRGYATYASSDFADEAEDPDSPQTYKHARTQESFISSSFTQSSTGEASQRTRATTPPTPN